MKLKKLMNTYYQEQVDSVDIAGGVWTAQAKGRGPGSRMFSFAFHAVLIGLIVSAMLLGRYQPSRLEQCMGIIVERYNVEDRITDSFDSLIIFIKKNRNPGGGL
jgi:hypothetical protein